MTLIMLLQSILVEYKVSYSYLSIFTADQNRDACLETKEQHIVIMNCELSKADFRRQGDIFEKRANSNKYGLLEGLSGPVTAVACSMHTLGHAI